MPVVLLVRSYHSTYQPPNYLLQGRPGGLNRQNSAGHTLKRDAAKAYLPRHIPLPVLLHSYATHLTHPDVNIQYLQEILGHQSPKTTMIYTHLSGKDIRDVRSPLDDMEI